MKLMRLSALFALTLLVVSGCQKPADGDTAKEAAEKGAEKAAEKAAEKGAEGTEAGAGALKPPADAKVMFLWPEEGSKVPTTFNVKFGVEGMTVTPAGQGVNDATKGHHHIIINGKPLDAGTVVPMNETNIHYGKGQTEAQLTLKPGKYTLTMQFADFAHRSYGPQLSKTINIEVVELPAKPKVFFVEPQNGATVKSPVKMKFGLEGKTIRPAGEDIKEKITGHHHVIVDGKPVPLAVIVPMNETHIHYGKGQTEAELELKPGKHTLTMQFADGAHRSYGPAEAATIEITVEE